MTENVNYETLVDKINKLLAKAKGTSFENEASVFLAKANELMEKYQISLFDLHTDDPINEEYIGNTVGGADVYKMHVLTATAKFYGCRILVHRGDGKVKAYTMTGPKSARVTASLMGPFVWKQVTKAATKLSKDGDRSRAVWIRTITNALLRRIHDLMEEEKEKKNQNGNQNGNGRSLVVVDAIEAFLKSKYSEIGTSRKSTSRYTESGMEAANNISLFRQTENNSQQKLIG